MILKFYRWYFKIRRKLVRREISGESFPLFRLIVVAAIISGVIQLLKGRPPESVAQTGSWWTDVMFMVAQVLGGIVLVISMYIRNETGLRVQTERIGNVMLMVTSAFYFMSVAANNQGIPETWATWNNGMIAAYLFIRILEDTAGAAEAKRVDQEANK